jgi:proline iminopeptidase
MPLMPIRNVSLNVEEIGGGYPLVLMHGGPGLDHWSLKQFTRCSDQFTLVFYDHRCNGRSTGATLTSFTWENLTADADALRERLGFERWAVLGHSFGGHVALEYALRYPDRVSHLVLLDTAADAHWARENAARITNRRGYGRATANVVRRFFTGQIEPRQFTPAVMRFMTAYMYRPNPVSLARLMFAERRTKMRPKTTIWAHRHLLPGWSAMDRLAQIRVPTLVMAGRDDFIFPPECQVELSSGIPGARLEIIERAGHNPQDEQPDEVMRILRDFIAAPVTASLAA